MKESSFRYVFSCFGVDGRLGEVSIDGRRKAVIDGSPTSAKVVGIRTENPSLALMYILYEQQQSTCNVIMSGA